METCLMVPETKSKCLVDKGTCQNVWAYGTSREMLWLSTYIYIYIKRASARVPPTPPSLGHNAIMLGLLEVVMLNVGSKCHGSCACNTRSMVQSNIVTQHLFTCLFP